MKGLQHEASVAFLLACLLVLVMCPGLCHPTRVLWGATDGDALGLVWTYWHLAWNLAREGSLGIHTSLVLFPQGATLFPADILEALSLAPLTLWGGPVFVFNLLQVLHVGLAAAAMALLAGAVVGKRGVGLAVAPALALSPVLLCTTQNGNPDVAQYFWLPLAGWSAWRALASGRLSHVAEAGLVLALAGITSPYLGIGAGVMVVAMILGSTDGHVAARRGAMILGLASVLALPVLLFAASTLGDGEVVEKTATTVRNLRLREGAASLVGFLAPGVRHVTDPRGGSTGFMNGWGVGWLLLALALPRLRAMDRLDRVLWGVVGVGLFLALGPVLKPASEPLILGGRLLPLPYVFLDLLPPFDMLIELWRFSALVQVGLGLLAARSLGRLAPRWSLLAGLLLVVESLCFSPGLAVWKTSILPDEPVAAITEDLAEGAILSFPVRQGDWPLHYQTQHHRPVANSPMNAGDPAVFEMEARGSWSLEDLRLACTGVGYRWVLMHMRPETRAEQPMDEILEDATAAGLVVRHEGNLAILDLSIPGPWPTRIYESRGLGNLPVAPRGLGAPSSP